MSNVRLRTRLFTPFLVAVLVTLGFSTMAQSSDYSDVVIADNPDGWWRMDSASDQTGNHTSMASFIGVTFGQTPGPIADDPSGYALFDSSMFGTITVTDAPDLNYGTTTDFSLVYWVKQSGTSTGAVIGKGIGVGPCYSSRMMNDGKIDVTLDYGTPLTTSPTDYLKTATGYNDGKWHQVVILADRNDSLKIYVDSQLAAQTDIRSVDTTLPLRIGGGPDGYAPDAMDEFAVYDKALTAADALAHYTVGATDPNSGAYASLITADAPIGWWRLDGLVAGVVVDASGNGHDGVPTAGVTFPTPGPILGDPDFYASLPGDDDIVIEDFEELHFGNYQDFSYETWFRLASGSGFQVLMDKGNRYGNVFIRNADDTGQLWCQLDYNRTTHDVRSTNVGFNDGDWHHVLVTADRDDALRMYVDGALEGTTSFDSDRDISSVGQDLTIGYSLNATTYYDGSLDEVALYSRLLSEAEIREQYLAAVPPSIPGDTDGDGDVDADDAAVLAGNWGSSVTGGAADGDFNSDGMVNAADASILAANWTGPGESCAVPEPGAMALVFGLIGTWLLWRGRTRPARGRNR